MPKTEHYQWYVEQFSDTELHHHAIDELYYSGRTAFQSVAVLRTAAFGKMLVLDGDTQSSQADEKIYHESLVHPALAACPTRREVLILGGGEGATLREVLRHPGVARCTMVDIDGEVVELAEDTCPSGRPERSTTRAPNLIIGDALAYIKQPGTFDAIISDLTEPLPDSPSFPLFNGEVFGDIKARLAPSGVYVLQASTAGFHNMALHAKMARSLRAHFKHVASFYTHVPAFDNDWAFIACSDASDVGQLPRRRSMRTSPSCAGRTTSTTRKRTAGCSACRSICGASWRRAATSSHERRRAAAHGAVRRASRARRADRALRRLRNAGAVRRDPGRTRRGARTGRDVRPLAHGAVRAARRGRAGLGGSPDGQPRGHDEAAPGALQHLHQRRRRRARRRDLLPLARPLAVDRQCRQRGKDVGLPASGTSRRR